MTFKEILDLYYSGEIYNADTLAEDVSVLKDINTKVVKQADEFLESYTDKSIWYSPSQKQTIFDNYVRMKSISSYLEFRIKKLEEKEGGATE
jgi:hypothetical protein